MKNKNEVQITKDQVGKELVMIRIDKTLREIMEEKPSSRWDVEYWHSKWENLYTIKLSAIDFGNLLLHNGITYGQVGQRIFSPKGIVKYLQVINIKSTGIDTFVKSALIEENSRNDPSRSRLKPGQLLLTRTTFPKMDTLIGRCIVVPKNIGKANVSEDIDVITLKNNISPEVVCIFLKTIYGQGQIHRKKKGVKSIKINFDDIRSIKMPIFPKNVEKSIVVEYEKMAVYHDKAMVTKKNGDDISYKKNLEKAESILKELIARTEMVIRGEREDIA